jgi:ATP-dependent RNA helicase DDX49/DBP8
MDEADRLLDPSFESDLRVLLPLLPDPSKRQSLLFSATLTPSLVKLQQASLADAHVFQVRAVADGLLVGCLRHLSVTPDSLLD